MTEIKINERIKKAGDVFFALEKCGWDIEGAASFLDSIPDAKDYVKVVRCKDCKLWLPVDWDEETLHCCDVFNKGTYADDFCSYGERKADG